MFILIASVFSIAERYLRSVIWINNIDQILISKELTVFGMFKEFIFCGSIILLRYFLCSIRHILSYHSALEKRNKFLLSTQKKWLNNSLFMSKDNNVIQETTSLIEQLGKHIEQRHCRIAIDLVPGIVSISIGLYNLYYYIELPTYFYCIGYLFTLELLYILGSQNLLEIEDVALTKVREIQAKMYSSMVESIVNKEIVMSYVKSEHELCNTENYTKECFKYEMKRIKTFNILDSLIKWMSQLVYIGIIIMTHNSNISETRILWVLYFAKETRGGFQEIYNYFRVRRTENKIKLQVDEMMSREKNTFTDSRLIVYSNTIKINKLSFSYTDKPIFSGISFSPQIFSKNNYTVVMGKNGSGKSSLCKILSGYETNVTIDNDSGKYSIPDTNKILICEQIPMLFESKTVLYNIVYGTHFIYNDKYLDFKEEFSNVCQEMDMKDMIDKRVSTLSGGEKQKVSLLRAYIRALYAPNCIELFILDEWNSALDMRSKHQGFSMIENIKKKTGCAVVWVSHIQIPQLLKQDDCQALILDSHNTHQEGKYNELWQKYVNQ